MSNSSVKLFPASDKDSLMIFCGMPNSERVGLVEILSDSLTIKLPADAACIKKPAPFSILLSPPFTAEPVVL